MCVGLQQTPVQNSDGLGSNIRTFIDNTPSLPLPPHFPHHSTLRADSPMLLDKTVQVWQNKKKPCRQTMYVSTPLATRFHTHQKCPLTEMFFPVASLFSGLQAVFSLLFSPPRYIQWRSRNIPDIIGV